MKNYFFLLALTSTFIFSSCSKDKDKDPAPFEETPADPANDPAAIQLTTQLLTGNEWKLTALTQGVPGQAIQNDIYNTSFPACQRDDVYAFATANNSLTITPGFASCSTTDQGKSGSWSLKNAKIITLSVSSLTQAGLTGEFNIFLLDNSKMILKQTVNGNEYIATYEKHTLTRRQILTGRKWVITAQTETVTDASGTHTSDIYAGMNACERDNFLQFNTSGDVVWDEGANKCSSASQTYTFSWAFNNNETAIIFDPGSFNSWSAEILELSMNTLKIKETYSFFGDTYVYITTYTGQ